MNSNAATLIILTPGFPANEEDTSCITPNQIFVKALKKNYPEVNIVVLAFQYPFIRLTYQWNDITVISFNGRNKGKILRLLLWRKVWRTLDTIKQQNNIIGIISFWMGECAFIGNKFAKKYGIKQFTWLLGQDVKPGNKYFKRINPNANNLIALSDFIAATTLKNYSIQPKYIIPVGIDSKLFSTEEKQRNIDIMGTGSLIALKQFDVFINVVNAVSKKIENIHAIICGKGPLKKRLRSQINTLELGSNIYLLDEVPHKEVLSLMQQSKIFLHTSGYEGFGAVCAEALYAGAHVISFVKPMMENIEHWHIVHSEEEMIQKVISILNNKQTEHTPVLPYPIQAITTSVMKLFN